MTNKLRHSKELFPSTMNLLRMTPISRRFKISELKLTIFRKDRFRASKQKIKSIKISITQKHKN